MYRSRIKGNEIKGDGKLREASKPKEVEARKVVEVKEIIVSRRNQLG